MSPKVRQALFSSREPFCNSLILPVVSGIRFFAFDIIRAMDTNHTHLINRAAVRAFTFAALAEKRPALVHKMTRISGRYYAKGEACVAAWIERELASMPSVGKTIR